VHHPAGRATLWLLCSAMLGLIPTPSRGSGAEDDGKLYSLPAGVGCLFSKFIRDVH
jgi:hypothetical protein